MIPEIKEFFLVSLIDDVNVNIHVSNLSNPMAKVYVNSLKDHDSALEDKPHSDIKSKIKKDNSKITSITRTIFGSKEMIFCLNSLHLPRNYISEKSMIFNFSLFIAYQNNYDDNLVIYEIKRHISNLLRNFSRNLKKTGSNSNNVKDLKDKVREIIETPPPLLKGELKISRVLFLLEHPLQRYTPEPFFFSSEGIKKVKEKHLLETIGKFLSAKCEVKLGSSSLSLSKNNIYLKHPENSRRKKISQEELFEIVFHNLITIRKSNIFNAYLYPVFHEFLVLEVINRAFPNGNANSDVLNVYNLIFDDRYSDIKKFLGVKVIKIPEDGYGYTHNLFETQKFAKLISRTYVISLKNDEQFKEYFNLISYTRDTREFSKVKKVDLGRRQIVWHTGIMGPSPLHISKKAESLYCIGYEDSLNLETSLFGNLDEYFEDFVTMKVFLYTIHYMKGQLDDYHIYAGALRDEILSFNEGNKTLVQETINSLYEFGKRLIELGELIRIRESFVNDIKSKVERGLTAYEIEWWEDRGDFSVTEASTYIKAEKEHYENIKALVSDLDSLAQTKLIATAKMEIHDSGYQDNVISERILIQTTAELLRKRINDYSNEMHFFQCGRVELVDFYDKKELSKISQKEKEIILGDKEDVFRNYLENEVILKSLSIVIPVTGRKKFLLECVKGILNQSFSEYHPELVEIIIVQDGYHKNPLDDPISSDLKKVFIHFKGKIKLFKLSENKGRSTARNVGIYYSKSDIIFFIDSTMVLGKNFLTEHMCRHDRIQRIALLGFKENISWKKYKQNASKIKDGLKTPDFRNDLKYFHVLQNDEAPFYFKDHLYQPNEKINFMELTKNFSQLNGMDSIGQRSLPTFFQTNIVSAPLNEVQDVGGFACEFDPMWGLEDSFLGALLFAKGLKLIPCPSSVAFKIEHKDEGETKSHELERNRGKYIELLTKESNKSFNKERLSRKIRQLKNRKILERVKMSDLAD